MPRVAEKGWWAVDVFEVNSWRGRRAHLACQLFANEAEARRYAKANACELGDSKNWSEVREAVPGEKEFA